MNNDLLALLAECCGTSEEVLLQPELDLLESSLLDSLARIDWLAVVADHYGVELQPTQIPPVVWQQTEKLLSYTTAAIQQALSNA